MKTLYVSDLDGTLMQPQAIISDRSRSLLNEAISRGALFTCATARTPATVASILKGLDMRLPAIVMTGASMWNPRTGEYSHMKHFNPEAARNLTELYIDTKTPTFLFTLDGHIIDIYHVGGELNSIQRQFMEERLGNPFKRFHVKEHQDTLPLDFSHVILYYTMLPDPKAASTYGLTKDLPGVRAQYYHDIFGPETGILEAFDPRATKAEAIKELAHRTGAERVVCFGDNINDLPMMQTADLAVAVENALPEVKQAADIVIGPNTADSVAEFIWQDSKN